MSKERQAQILADQELLMQILERNQSREVVAFLTARQISRKALTDEWQVRLAKGERPDDKTAQLLADNIVKGIETKLFLGGICSFQNDFRSLKDGLDDIDTKIFN